LNTVEIKDSLRQGRVVIGTWVYEFNSPGLPRLLKSTGVDFVVYDMEHSGFGIDTVRTLIALSRPLNLAALVRPPAARAHLIAPLLDVGASGIIAPMIETARDASEVAETCRYRPQGRRGASFSIAHDDFLPGDVSMKMKKANDAVLCAVLIESERGVENLDEILAVPGIDLVWMGFLDLSLSMGIPGEYTHPRFQEITDLIVKTCSAHRTPVGIAASDANQAQKFINQGFGCIGYSGDLWLLQRALSEGVAAIRANLAADQSPNTSAKA
jgi:2-keto-3-deoxy-L-rhamnonate aldolase RhmA